MLNFTANEDVILNPTLWIGSFEWREPITTLTDLLTAFVCFYAFFKFKNYTGNKSISFSYYQYYFLFFALGMASAAWFGHGLQAYVGFNWKIIGWVMSATGFLLLEIGSLNELKSHLPERLSNGFKIIFYVQYIVFVGLMILTKDFVIPQVNSTLSLILVVLPLQVYAYSKNKNKAHALVFGAILYGAIPGLVYNNQISLSNWFNYHDISHVLMALFMVAIYIGTSKLSFNKS